MKFHLAFGIVIDVAAVAQLQLQRQLLFLLLFLLQLQLPTICLLLFLFALGEETKTRFPFGRLTELDGSGKCEMRNGKWEAETGPINVCIWHSAVSDGEFPLTLQPNSAFFSGISIF